MIHAVRKKSDADLPHFLQTNYDCSQNITSKNYHWYFAIKNVLNVFKMTNDKYNTNSAEDSSDVN